MIRRSRKYFELFGEQKFGASRNASSTVSGAYNRGFSGSAEEMARKD